MKERVHLETYEIIKEHLTNAGYKVKDITSNDKIYQLLVDWKP